MGRLTCGWTKSTYASEWSAGTSCSPAPPRSTRRGGRRPGGEAERLLGSSVFKSLTLVHSGSVGLRGRKRVSLPFVLFCFPRSGELESRKMLPFSDDGVCHAGSWQEVMMRLQEMITGLQEPGLMGSSEKSTRYHMLLLNYRHTHTHTHSFLLQGMDTPKDLSRCFIHDRLSSSL